MIAKAFYTLFAVAALFILGYGLFIWEFGHGFVRSNEDNRNPDCRTHEASRISFHIKDKGYDLNRMLDSFQILHDQYKVSDYSAIESNHGNIDQCACCCIEYGKEIYLPGSPKEIYRINIERFRYHAGFEGQYYDDIGYIDIISTFKNGSWHCSLTSKLDSSEKRRVRTRFNLEILSKLPLVKDTSSHEDELKL
jgi:hypothetical protein